MMSGGYTSIDNQKVSGSVPAVSDSGRVSVQFTDSGLQTFPSSGVQGKIFGGVQPPRDADYSFSRPAGGSPRGSDESQGGGWLHKFTVAAYKPYFDVDTSDALDRLKESLYPFRGTFTEKTATNPDLYGPFWICSTLIFVAAAIGTFVTYIAHKFQDKEWNYDINLITWSAGVYSMDMSPWFLSPCMLFSSTSQHHQALSNCFAYTPYLSLFQQCVYLWSPWKFLIAGVAGFLSATFVALNLKSHITSAGESWFLIVAGIFLLQLALAVVLKLYMFTVSV